MGKLEVGELLSLSTGTGTGTATVTAVRVERLAELVKVYNFQVAKTHTYFAAPEAGQSFVWVHNANYGKASQLATVKRGTRQWDEAVMEIRKGGKTNYRVESATDAKALLKEARGNMNRYKRYTTKEYDKGFEMHPDESHTVNAPHNDLPHVKWKDWHSKKAPGKGHIFFDVPN